MISTELRKSLQLGGDVDKLIAAIGKGGEVKAEGYGIYECTFSEKGMQACQGLLKDFQIYAQDGESGLSGQIKKYVASLTQPGKVHTFGETQILFPIDNTFDSLVNKAKGIYYDKSTKAKDPNTAYPVAEGLTKAVSDSNNAYTKQMSALDELLKIKTLTGNTWNYANLKEVQSDLVSASNELLTFTKELCMKPEVVANKDMQKKCISGISELLKSDVLTQYKTKVKDKFKGFKVFTNAGSSGTYLEFLLPQVDGGTTSFIDVISPLNLTYAKFNPLGEWVLGDDNKLQLSPYTFSMMPDLYLQQYHSNTDGRMLEAKFDSSAGTLTLTGDLIRESGSAGDSITELSLNGLRMGLTAIPLN